MNILIIVLLITVTILSIIVFKIKGLLLLLITIPLFIMYIKSNKIINLLKKDKKENYILSERKEVEIVSSRDRNKAVKSAKKEKENKKKKKSTKEENKKIVKTKKKKADNRRKEEKQKKKKKSVLKTLLSIFLSLCILGVFAVAAFMVYIVVSTEDFDPEALKNQDQTVVYDRNGVEFATLGEEKRESVDFDDLPQVLIDAIIATEDSRYYEHNGVDMARFIKASILQVLGRDDAGGASTLTMQVVKNNLTDTTSSGIKGIIRKFKDVYLSVFFMEKKYTKNEIIEMYVNDSCLGGTIYGVEEASNYYFGKSVSELSLPEASLLAGMYQAPNRYNPYKYPEKAQSRRNIVLTLMVRHGYITEEEKEMANAVSIESMLVGKNKESGYQGYLDTVIEEVINKTGMNPAKVSMKIYTGLDRNIQNGINGILSGETYTAWRDDVIQAGIAVTDVNTGVIVAIGAGRNREAGDWNYATQSHRQPGSTAKPIFDYGPGFEYNNYSTYTLFNDEKWGYTNGPIIGNWDGKYLGLMTLKEALSTSRNIPALKAFQQTNKKNIVNFANGLGLDIALNPSSDNYKKYSGGGDNAINEAYSIGGVSYGFTPLEMAEAYASFANGGYHIETHAVTKIEYRTTGEVVEFNYDREKVMSDSTAYLINNVLQYAVEHGHGGGSRVYGSTVAAKTGTSNVDDKRAQQLGIPEGCANDLWTVAYTPEYAVALWYGYEKTTSQYYMPSSSAPKNNVMAAVMQHIPKTTKKWTMPSSVVAVTIEKETWPAQLASEYTPDDMKTVEYFKKGTQPTEKSNRYAKLNSVTNLTSTKTTEGYKLTWNWKTPEVLDITYLSNYFNNSVYGNESAKYLQQRLDYNTNILGGNGFSIYSKSNTGELKLIAYTETNEYLYIPSTNEDITLVVKAEYKNFKTNASDGTEIKIENDGSFVKEKEFKITLKGENNLEITKGNYEEKGIAATYDNVDVTDDIDIKYQIKETIYNTKQELEEAINNLSNTEIEIKYTVSYKNKIKNITRKVIISE